jgi:hypothetical protein
MVMEEDFMGIAADLLEERIGTADRDQAGGPT